MGFWGAALTVFFTEKGASFLEIGLLSLTSYPFSLKILTAPILDTFYFPKVGKRKSYILPTQYLMAGIFFSLGYCNITRWIDEMHIDFLTILGIFTLFLAA